MVARAASIPEQFNVAQYFVDRNLDEGRGDVVAVFFRELPDGRWRVSLRSKGEVNVSAVAEHFGGGGHKCASGCSLDGPMEVAVSRVVERLRVEKEAVKTA